MSADLERGFTLGDWRVYPLRNLLDGPAGEVRIEPKVMQVLERLAAARGEVVERDTLLHDVWGERALSDEPLTRCIATLRRELGDSSRDPNYIQTIPKRGYRLVCPVEPLASGATPPEVSDSAKKSRRVLAAFGGVTGAALAVFAIYVFVSNEPAEAPQISVEGAMTSDAPIRSIAVLPFANLSPDPENDYLSDGLASELQNRLTRIPDLKVAARTSAFSFKGEDRDVTEIARQLRVAHLLTGSVRQSGDKLRISAELVDGTDGYHIWSESWEQEFSDIFEIQDAITESVVASLRIELLDQDLAIERTDPEAYALYLEAQEMVHEPVTGSDPAEQFEAAISKMLEAVAIDPDYAPAWSSLASMQVSMAEWTFEQDTAPVYASARASARRALSLDPDDARALRALGYIDMLREWDTVSAARWFGKALLAAPGDAATLTAVGYLYSRLRPGQSMGMLEDVEDYDPLDTTALLNRVFGSLYEGDLDAARRFLGEATQVEPDAIRVRAAEGLIAYLDGDFESALRLATDSTPSMRACALYRLGRTGEADRELDELVSAAPFTAYHVAAVHACRGDADSAFEWLNRAWENRHPALLTIRGNWYMSPLHGDPRWPLLLEKIGVSDKHAEQVDAILEPVLYGR